MAAFSPSDGQFAICCQLCEEQNDIKWKCLTCDFLICTRCCKVHRKIKSTEHHEVVSLDTVAKPTVPNVDFTNIKCTIHDNHVCCLFCVDCKEVICPLCVSKNHNKHYMSEIQEGYRSTLERVESLISEMDDDMFNTISNLPMLESIRSSEHSKYETEKGKILSQDKALKKMVDEKTKSLLDEIDQKWNHLSEILNNEERKVENISQKLEEDKKILKLFSTSKTADDLVEDIIAKRNQKNKSISTDLKPLALPMFFPGEITLPFLTSLHGSLKNEKENDDSKILKNDNEGKRPDFLVNRNEVSCQTESYISLQILEKYKTSLSSIHTISCCHDGQLWISDNQSDTLEKICLCDGKIQTIKSYQIKIADMAIFPSGDLLLATSKSELRIIPISTGQIRISNFRNMEMNLKAVHITRNNTILVAAKKKYTNQFFGDDQPKEIIEFNRSGKIERNYCLDDNKRPLFSNPYRMTTDSKNNIFVIDLKYDDNYKFYDDNMGRVIVLEPMGRVRGIYYGHPIVNQDTTFTPADLVATPSDYIIVSDDTVHGLHILNDSNQCVKFQSTVNAGIIKPISLCIDNRGLLFIGCDSQYEEKDDARIYVVKFSGF